MVNANQEDFYLNTAARIMEHRDDLVGYGELVKSSGIEGWVKIHAVRANPGLVSGIQNKGADIVLKDGSSIELKGSTDTNASYYIDGMARYPNTPLLFLGGGQQISKCLENLATKCELVDYKRFFVGEYEYVIAMIAPRAQLPEVSYGEYGRKAPLPTDEEGEIEPDEDAPPTQDFIDNTRL